MRPDRRRDRQGVDIQPTLFMRPHPSPAPRLACVPAAETWFFLAGHPVPRTVFELVGLLLTFTPVLLNPCQLFHQDKTSSNRVPESGCCHQENSGFFRQGGPFSATVLRVQ
jgi:hypothetical protein